MIRTKQHMLLALITISYAFSSCQVVGGIFKAGVWTGVIVVVMIIALIIYLISKAPSKK